MKLLSKGLFMLFFIPACTFSQSSVIKYSKHPKTTKTRVPDWGGNWRDSSISQITGNEILKVYADSPKAKGNTNGDPTALLNNFYAGIGGIGDKNIGEIGTILKNWSLSGTTNLQILNRATINLDSLKTIANSYLLSLSASPVTLRFSKRLFAGGREQTSTEHPFIFGAIINVDGRAVPFGNQSGTVNIGYSGHLFATLVFHRRATDVSGGDDPGELYFEPSFYIATATSDLLNSISMNNSKNYIAGIDFKLGFKSDKNSINDIGLAGYYTWDKIVGPNFRIGLVAKPK